MSTLADPPGRSPLVARAVSANVCRRRCAMASIEIKDRDLVIHIHGWDKLAALRSTLTLPLSEVKGVSARPGDARYDEMEGVRLAGGYWPGAFAAGYFWVTGGAGGDRRGALDKLAEVKALLGGGGEDPGEHVAAALAEVELAAAEMKKALAEARLPEDAKYLAFYDVHHEDRTIGLDVEHGRLRRVVIELDDEDPEAAVARVRAALASP